MKKGIAVVGYGGQGAWHCNHALKSNVVSLEGIYDIDFNKSKLATKNGVRAYSSLDEIIADETVDIVVVATPNDSHKDITIKALLGGKNVICEKPVAMNLAELDEMLTAANKRGSLFTVHQNRRFDADYLGMKSIIESGEIGEVIRIESRIHGSRGIPSDWRGKKAQGGGMLFDWGVHLIDQIMLLIPEKVLNVACEFTHITNNEVDDGFRLSLTFESGKTAYVEVGTYNFLPLPRFYMQCKSGTAIIKDWRESAKIVKCNYWHESEVLPVQTAAGITKTMAPRDDITTTLYSAPYPESDVHDFYRNFCHAIDGKENQLVTHNQIKNVFSVIEAAFVSAKKGGIKTTL